MAQVTFILLLPPLGSVCIGPGTPSDDWIVSRDFTSISVPVFEMSKSNSSANTGKTDPKPTPDRTKYYITANSKFNSVLVWSRSGVGLAV